MFSLHPNLNSICVNGKMQHSHLVGLSWYMWIPLRYPAISLRGLWEVRLNIYWCCYTIWSRLSNIFSIIIWTSLVKLLFGFNYLTLSLVWHGRFGSILVSWYKIVIVDIILLVINSMAKAHNCIRNCQVLNWKAKIEY